MDDTAYYAPSSGAEDFNVAGHFLGHAFLDIMAIENGHVRGQISDYLTESEDDYGGVSLHSLRKMARSSGVKATETISHKIDMIRAIQMATLHQPCFGSELRTGCKKEDCNWRYECKNQVVSGY